MNLKIFIEFFFQVPVILNYLNILVIDCPGSFNTGEQTVLVVSNNKTFYSNGTLICKNGGALFFQNGTATLSNATTCSFDATWTDQEYIQCWKGWFRTESLLKWDLSFRFKACFFIAVDVGKTLSNSTVNNLCGAAGEIDIVWSSKQIYPDRKPFKCMHFHCLWKLFKQSPLHRNACSSNVRIQIVEMALCT